MDGSPLPAMDGSPPIMTALPTLMMDGSPPDAGCLAPIMDGSPLMMDVLPPTMDGSPPDAGRLTLHGGQLAPDDGQTATAAHPSRRRMARP